MINNIKQNKALIITIALILFASVLAINYIKENKEKTSQISQVQPFKPEITKSDEEWKKLLTPQQYYVLRQKGTDLPFSETILLNEHRKGTFVTADCDEPVFRSETKFDSHTGWPSFWQPIEGSVVEMQDTTGGFIRTEIIGKKCGGHLGHVFNDGPAPTGLRYCINPSALKFIPDPV